MYLLGLDALLVEFVQILFSRLAAVVGDKVHGLSLQEEGSSHTDHAVGNCVSTLALRSWRTSFAPGTGSASPVHSTPECEECNVVHVCMDVNCAREQTFPLPPRLKGLGTEYNVHRAVTALLLNIQTDSPLSPSHTPCQKEGRGWCNTERRVGMIHVINLSYLSYHHSQRGKCPRCPAAIATAHLSLTPP